MNNNDPMRIIGNGAPKTWGLPQPAAVVPESRQPLGESSK